MEKTCFIKSLATFALVAASPLSTYAQSNVTIYGLVDSGIEYLNNVGVDGKGLWRQPTLTGSSPSRLGFRGREDLGNGLAAIFTLEQGFGMDTGGLNQGGRLFGRQAFVGLTGPWGTLSFGRQYTMTFLVFTGLSIVGPNVHTPLNMDSYLPNARVDNSVAYRGVFGPWTVGATYSFGRDSVALPAGASCGGELVNDGKACRNASALLRYDTKSWGLAASHEVSHGGPGAGGGLTSSSLTDQRTVLGGYVALDKVQLGAGILLRNNEGSATPKSRLWWAGVSYQFTPALTADLQAGRINFVDSPNDSSSYVARLTYYLSKRTAAYVSMAHIRNEGTAAMSVSGGAVSGSAPAPGQGQSGLMLGVRHAF